MFNTGKVISAKKKLAILIIYVCKTYNNDKNIIFLFENINKNMFYFLKSIALTFAESLLV